MKSAVEKLSPTRVKLSIEVPFVDLKPHIDGTYNLTVNQKFINYQWTDEEKQRLRPIAETIALLDGNAFFPHNLADGREWYEQYLPEAATVFDDNGGLDGWAGEISWIKDIHHENESVKEAYDSWQVIKKLSTS